LFQPFWRGNYPDKTVIGKIQTTSIRGNFPRMNSQGLAIVNLRLSTVDKRGDPFQAVVNYLEAFFSPSAADGGLSTLNLDFDINPTKIKSIETHHQIVNGFIQRMCQYAQPTVICQ
jgi:hypothetical protein